MQLTTGKPSSKSQRLGLCIGIIFFLLLAITSAWAQKIPQTNLPRTSLSIGIYKIDAQIASTYQQLQTGLMGRLEMPENEGMLFIFDRPGIQCFWMKNNPLPLSAAFVADDGTITNIENMQPLSLDDHCSIVPVRYVLEMHQGWFEKRGVRAGMPIQGEVFSK